MSEFSSRLYEAAGRIVAPLLQLDGVEHIYIRRSVAAGEAQFPWSDLDLGLVIRAMPGAELWRLQRRFRSARILFPRMGECQVATAAELVEMTQMDPYRGSLDRRFAIALKGGRPPIPEVTVTREAAARRLVFWFEHYLPLAVRRGNIRNQVKFTREMANALGVVDGRRAEPFRSRRESAVPEDLNGLRPFVQCCHIAERAQALLRPPAPRITAAVHWPGLILLPHPGADLPEIPARTIVATPAVLDLLLATQKPELWLRHGPALVALGFAAPPRRAWLGWCLRQCSGERLRLPGFGETGPIDRAARLAAVEGILDSLERGQSPGIPSRHSAITTDLRRYYSIEYDRLVERAAGLRARIGHLTPGAAVDE